MITLRVAPLLLAAALLSSSAYAQDSLPPGARAAADNAVRLYGQRKYEEMYRSFGSPMKKAMTLPQWLDQVKKLENLTGTFKTRQEPTLRTSMGVHRFTFDALYSHGRATEEIYVVEENGQWVVSGFQIKPNFGDDSFKLR